MTLFDDDRSATSGAHYHEPAAGEPEASEPEGFTMPRQGISTEHITEAVRVLSAEIGRPVTAREIQQRFSMQLAASPYLAAAARDETVFRVPRKGSEEDRSRWAYYVNTDVHRVQYRSATRTAKAFSVTRSTVLAWGSEGFIATIVDRRNQRYLLYAQEAWLPAVVAADVLNVHRRTVAKYAAQGVLQSKHSKTSAEYLYRLTPDLVAKLRKDKRKRRPIPVPEPTITPQRPSIVQPEPTPEPSVPTVQTRERVTLRDVLALVLAWIADLLGVNR